ncbi:hypothetical protein [Antarctobacter sp.]|uniref:hypothetical protein n=1 Tax=Antarctobacter sp. TaxID=1872577 RepID=UPI003A8EF92D
MIPEAYDRGANLSGPGGLETLRFDGADRFWIGLRAAFSNATFTIHHMNGREDPMMPPRTAIHRGLHGKHEGWGALGTPTGAEVYVLGIRHAEFGAVVGGAPKLRREWTLFNETAIWKQILLKADDL